MFILILLLQLLHYKKSTFSLEGFPRSKQEVGLAMVETVGISCTIDYVCLLNKSK
jgi:hypothetical protein